MASLLASRMFCEVEGRQPEPWSWKLAPGSVGRELKMQVRFA